MKSSSDVKIVKRNHIQLGGRIIEVGSCMIFKEYYTDYDFINRDVEVDEILIIEELGKFTIEVHLSNGFILESIDEIKNLLSWELIY